jgi:hypothetical protein
VRTPPTAAGKKGKCPHCQAIVQIPQAAPQRAAPAKKPASPAKKPAQPAAPAMPAKSAHAPADSAALAAPRAPAISPKLAPPGDADPNIGASYPLGSGLTPAERNPTLRSTEIAGLDSLAPRAPRPEPSGLAPWPDSGGLTPLPDSSGLMPLPDSGGLTPLPSENAGLTPLGADATGLTPLGGGGLDFPDAYPIAAMAGPALAAAPAGRTDSDLRMMVLLPAIFQMLSTLPAILYILVLIGGNLLGLFSLAQATAGASTRIGLIVGVVINIVFSFVWLACLLFVIKGSLDLMHRRSYLSALVASILNLLFCTCGIGFPFGLWSLIVLCFSDVRQSFHR